MDETFQVLYLWSALILNFTSFAILLCGSFLVFFFMLAESIILVINTQSKNCFEMLQRGLLL